MNKQGNRMELRFLSKENLVKVWGILKTKIEAKSNKVTSIDETSTDELYPSAKAVDTYVKANTALGEKSMKIIYEDGTEETIKFAEWE